MAACSPACGVDVGVVATQLPRHSHEQVDEGEAVALLAAVGGDGVAGGRQRVLEPQAVEDELVDLVDPPQLAREGRQLAELGADLVVQLERHLDLGSGLGTDLLGILLAQEVDRIERLVLGAAGGQQSRQRVGVDWRWCCSVGRRRRHAQLPGSQPVQTAQDRQTGQGRLIPQHSLPIERVHAGTPLNR